MSDISIDPVSAQALGKRLNYLAALLIAIAFIGPGIATFAGIGNAFSVGEDAARTLGSLAFLAFIAWLVVRKKNDLAKSKARVVVGILLCAVVTNNIVNAAREKEQSKMFVQQALAFQEKHSAKFQTLAQRMDQVTVAQYLTPEALTSPAGVEAGQAALERYHSLLQERNLLVQTYLAEYTSFISGLPAGKLRDGAESTVGRNKAETENLYGMLDRAQGEHAAAIGAIFEWAQSNMGKVTLRNGQFLFSSAEQQQRLQVLVNRLQQAENEANAAMQKAQTIQTAAIEKSKKLEKDAATFLAK